jgi:hypothetical protein
MVSLWKTLEDNLGEAAAIGIIGVGMNLTNLDGLIAKLAQTGLLLVSEGSVNVPTTVIRPIVLFGTIFSASLIYNSVLYFTEKRYK